MIFCGIWHGVAWNFVVWGALQAIGLIWVGTLARDAGRRLPTGVVDWWRRHPLAHALSVAVTFQYFSTTLIFAVTDVGGALRYLGALLHAALGLVR
jgi:D-alanyl-lipoteichoic acid acyltransferase DltB (MBOAT superfamily)